MNFCPPISKSSVGTPIFYFISWVYIYRITSVQTFSKIWVQNLFGWNDLNSFAGWFQFTTTVWTIEQLVVIVLQENMGKVFWQLCMTWKGKHVVTKFIVLEHNVCTLSNHLDACVQILLHRQSEYGKSWFWRSGTLSILPHFLMWTVGTTDGMDHFCRNPLKQKDHSWRYSTFSVSAIWNKICFYVIFIFNGVFEPALTSSTSCKACANFNADKRTAAVPPTGKETVPFDIWFPEFQTQNLLKHGASL